LLIRVGYSSLNYKDALSATGNKGVTRNYPHTPGIDAAGIIVESQSPDFKAGEEVIVTGNDLGMNTPGGFGEYIRIPAAWPVKLPKGLSLKESMVYGTAGFTAALSVYKLINYGVKPEDGTVLVTGATGGVGSLAAGFLAKLGYSPACATGKLDESGFLISLGAREVISRKDIDDTSGRPMLKGRWAGVIDTVGGNILSTAIKSTNYGGCVTTCGNVASAEFTTSVFPFILRGVALLGVDSVLCPMDLRLRLWEKMAGDWKLNNLESLSEECSLEELEGRIERILKGTLKGRVVVKHNM
ncbi:MAG: YhdH/YhfP family quinone oxidoreductase, partial [Bacillota bacterium]|nr:YhdH/YhfP family quinone oxidoreductase [Bacillota bacterium]